MRGESANAIIAVLLLGCAAPARMTMDERPWIELETQNIAIWTCAHERTAKRLARNLELFRSVSEFVIGKELPKARLPLRMVHFPDVRSYAPFAPPGSAGVYLSSMREDILLSSGTSMHVIQHEYTHFLLENHSDFIYPPWYHEGFAEFLGATRFRGHDVEIGGTTAFGPPRLTNRGRDAWTHVRELLAFGVGGHSGEDVRQRYPQSWALVHYLYFGRGDGTNGARQVGRYLRLVQEGADIDSAVESAFGMTVEQLDQQLRDYVATNRYKAVIAEVEKFGTIEDPAVTPLDPVDVALQLGKLALRQGNEQVARNYFDKVLAERPRDPGALVGNALLKLSEEPDAEIEAKFREALAANPDDARTHLLFGNLLRWWASREEEDAAARADLARRARKHYVKSWMLDDRVPETYARYGATFLLDGEDAAKGLETLQHAHAMLPASVQIRSALAQVHMKMGDEEVARRLALSAYSSPFYGTNMSEEDIEDLEEVLESTGGLPRDGHAYD
jgi:Flp pilus assembly protein TadD